MHGESQQLADAQERIRGLEEDLANADWVHEDYVHRESQQLADAQEQIQELEEDLASTGMELRGEMIKVECFTHQVVEKSRQFDCRNLPGYASNLFLAQGTRSGLLFPA